MGMVFNTKTSQWVASTMYDKTNEDLLLPYPLSKGCQPQPLYIYKGVMVDTKEDFDACVMLQKDNVDFLAHCAKHPIIDISYDYRSITNQSIVKGDGIKVSQFTGNISPLGSGKIYKIENGNLQSLSFIDTIINENKKDDESSKVIQLNVALPFNQQNDEAFLKSLEVEQKNDFNLVEPKKTVDFLDQEDEEDENEEVEIAESIDAGITNVLTEIQEVNSQLIDHQDNPLVRDFLLLNNDVINSYDEFLQKNVNNLIMNN
jgi:hypothetical protein